MLWLGLTRINATAIAITIPNINDTIASGIETNTAALTMGKNPLMTNSALASVIKGNEARKLFNTDISTKELFT